MKYAVMWQAGGNRLWWAALEEAVNINAGRYLDGLAPIGIIRICEAPEEAMRVADAMWPMSRGLTQGRQE